MSFNAGVVWQTCGQPDKARLSYERSSLWSAKNNLGVMAFRNGRNEAAKDLFRDAIDAAPTAAAPRQNLAAVHRLEYVTSGSTESFARAERLLKSMLVFEGARSDGYEELARLYYDRSSAGERSFALLANLVIDQGLKQHDVENTKSAELHNLRGLLAIQRREPTAALRSFEAAIDIEPTHANALLNAALVELELRSFDAARTHLDRAAASGGPYEAEIALALGVAHRGRRDYDRAKAAYARALELGRSDPRARYNLGVLYQLHLAPNAAAAGFEEVDEARRNFVAFTEQSKGTAQLAAARDAALARIRNIDEYKTLVTIGKKIDAEAKAMELAQRKEEEERRAHLLQLERDAQDALSASTHAESSTAD